MSAVRGNLQFHVRSDDYRTSCNAGPGAGTGFSGSFNIVYKPMKIGLIRTAALFAMASLGTAQTVRWTTPVLGYYFDSESKSIRTIAGVPGSAALEGGLAVGSKLERAAVSPSRDYAFATVLDS